MAGYIRLAVFTLVVFGFTACMGDQDPEPALGHVDMALVTAGAGGTLYRLPVGTEVLAFGLAVHHYSLDVDSPTMTVDIPTGSYQILLVNNVGYMTEWPLERMTPDGIVDTVQATLEPISAITVVANQTTPLTLRFRVADTSIITFTQGSLQIGVEVDEIGDQGNDAGKSFRIVIPSLTTSKIVGAAPPELIAQLPENGTINGSLVITALRSSQWFVSNSSTVCTRMQVQIEVMGVPTFAAIIEEQNLAPTSFGTRFCFRQATPTSGFFTMVRDRQGLALTSIFSNFGERQYEFEFILTVHVNTMLYDGATLDLRALKSPTPSLVQADAAIYEVHIGEAEPYELWYRLLNSGDGIMEFGNF